MDPATKSSLLWGAVGALSFLVLLQAYHLWRGEFVEVPVVAGVVVLVFGTTAVAAHLIRPQLAGWNERT